MLRRERLCSVKSKISRKNVCVQKPATEKDAFFMGKGEKACGGPEFTYGRVVFKGLKKVDIDKLTK